MTATQGIYQRAKEQLAKAKAETPFKPPKEEQLAETIDTIRKEYDSFMAELDKAKLNLEAVAKSLPEKRRTMQEFMVLTKILKDESASLDKVERDTLLMLQTYLKMQGVTPPMEG